MSVHSIKLSWVNFVFAEPLVLVILMPYFVMILYASFLFVGIRFSVSFTDGTWYFFFKEIDSTSGVSLEWYVLLLAPACHKLDGLVLGARWCLSCVYLVLLHCYVILESSECYQALLPVVATLSGCFAT